MRLSFNDSSKPTGLNTLAANKNISAELECIKCASELNNKVLRFEMDKSKVYILQVELWVFKKKKSKKFAVFMVKKI